MQSYTLQFAPLLTALVASASITPVARRLALRVGLIDMPGPRKIHSRPTPLLGGVAIYAGVLLATVVFVDGGSTAQIVAVMGTATFLLVIGIFDDRGWLHHQVKLWVAMPLAALTLMVAGIRTDALERALSPSADSWRFIFWVLDYGLTVLWVVGITAAFSILDHMDGLCAGVAGIAAVFFWWIAASHGQILVSLLALALVGATLGFLWWNFNPAKIFMGDGGAMFLGFMLATLGLKLRGPASLDTTHWMVPVLILGVPIFDTTLVTISRLRRGLIPFQSPGKDHTAHRLTAAGLSLRQAVIVMYGIGVLCGILAIVVTRLDTIRAFVLFGSVLVIALLLLIVLEHFPFEGKESPENRGGL